MEWLKWIIVPGTGARAESRCGIVATVAESERLGKSFKKQRYLQRSPKCTMHSVSDFLSKHSHMKCNGMSELKYGGMILDHKVFTTHHEWGMIIEVWKNDHLPKAFSWKNAPEK